MTSTLDGTSIITQKRIRNELKDLKKNMIDSIQVIQDENDPFVFFFLLRGEKDSAFDGGFYMGKILLPKDYPVSPVDCLMLTPSGRFQINNKICLTNTGFHPESWSTTWTLEKMLVGFISVWTSTDKDDTHGLSHINESDMDKRKYAKNSVKYNLSHYDKIFKSFDQFVNPDGTMKPCQDKDVLPKKKEKSAKTKKDEPEKMVKSKTNEPEKSKKIQSVKSIDDAINYIKQMTFETFDVKMFEHVQRAMNGELVDFD